MGRSVWRPRAQLHLLYSQSCQQHIDCEGYLWRQVQQQLLAQALTVWQAFDRGQPPDFWCQPELAVNNMIWYIGWYEAPMAPFVGGVR